jgi:hypothetical protein
MCEANRFDPGSGRKSMVASRRSRKMAGVGPTTPNPSGRLGSTRRPNQMGLRVTHLLGEGDGEAEGGERPVWVS